MIGVLGGTFDPIHFGHLRPALEMRQALGLAEVRFVPLNVAVHRCQPEASGAQRLAMVRAAVGGEPRFRVDARELQRTGRSYSYETLRSLRSEVGDRQPICLLTGSDAFRDFLSWHRPDDILELAHLVVMQRPGAAAGLDARLSAGWPAPVRRGWGSGPAPGWPHPASSGHAAGYLVDRHPPDHPRRAQSAVSASGCGARHRRAGISLPWSDTGLSCLVPPSPLPGAAPWISPRGGADIVRRTHADRATEAAGPRYPRRPQGA